MDTGEGYFKEIPEEVFNDAVKREDISGKFCIDQEVECNGSKFRVIKIKRNKLTLKLLPKDK